jgi:phosphopantetheinyl transferase
MDSITVFCMAKPEGTAVSIDRLSDGERMRAQRLRRAQDRQLFVAAHALLGYALRRLGADAALVAAGASGKPFIAGGGEEPPPFFNLSYCSGMAVCAVSRTRQVGVDVERVDAAGAGDAAEIAFCAAEREWIADDPFRFVQLWTMKEALFKLEGVAWSEAWKQRSILAAVTGKGASDGPTWQRRLGSEHLAALACSGDIPAAVAWIWVGGAELTA